jgi:phospholipid N-methyltransferase
MTRALIKNKDDSTILTCCEIEEDRFDGLKKYENEHTKIVLMDAENCLKQFQAESVDLVVSTLPL